MKILIFSWYESDFAYIISPVNTEILVGLFEKVMT